MTCENSHDANGGESLTRSGADAVAAAPANIIPFPGAVACADLPVVAPEAVSGFDRFHAVLHIALLLGQLAEAAEYPILVGALDDDKERKSPKLTAYTLAKWPEIVLNTPFLMKRKDGGTFWKEGLLDLQSKGAALYVTINEMKGDRRLRDDVIRFRSVFLEYDNPEGKPLEEILKEFPIAPSFIVETSRHAENGIIFSKYHFYWRPAEDWPATPENEKLWYGIQCRLVLEYGGDDNAYDSARWLRLAGSLHCKRLPGWRVRILDANGRPYTLEDWKDLEAAFANVPRYMIAKLAEAFPPEEIEGGAAQADAGLEAPTDPIARQLWEAALAQDWTRVKNALRYILPDCSRKVWISIGMALRSKFADAAYPLWDAWSEAAGYSIYPGSTETWEKWSSFDEPGDRSARAQVGLATIFHYAKQNGWPEGPIPQRNAASLMPRASRGPQIAPGGVRKDAGPVTIPAALLPASGPATASAGALPAPAAADAFPAAEASTQAAPWMDMPSPFAASAAAASKTKGELIWKPWELLEDMNARYAFIEDRGGRAAVLENAADPSGKPVERYLRIPDFKEAESNRGVERENDKGKKTFVTAAKFWQSHPGRRTYKGVTFDPRAGKLVNGYLNTWQGFAVEPKPGDWSLMRAHIEEVIAAGNKEHAAYIIKWLAWALQNPEKVAEVALVLRSGEGTGKGLLGNLMVKIYGSHGIHLNQPSLLTGRFSGHFENVCFAFADESFWAGDQAGRGTLYTKITEKQLMIEPKGINAFQAANRVKFIIAGNADWLVPAGPDARRWAVFDVSEAKKGDHAYFDALANETYNCGGAEAMLHELLARDLEGWHPRKDVPQTEALMQQKLSSLKATDAWILHLLQTGELPRPDGLRLPPNMAPAAALLADLMSLAKHTSYVTHMTIADLLTGPKGWGCTRNRASGRGYTFPPLREMRAQWCKRFGATAWNNPDADWAGAPIEKFCAGNVVNFAQK